MSKIVCIHMHLQCMLVHWHVFREHTVSSEMHTECSTYICNQSMNVLICTHMQQTETMRSECNICVCNQKSNASECDSMQWYALSKECSV